MRLFVYGSLRRFREDHVLLAGASYLGQTMTAPKYRLADVNGDGYVDMLDHGSDTIPGELYDIDPEVARRVNSEELPIYRREPVELFDGTSAEAYIVHAPPHNMANTLAFRVAARYQRQAKEFSSPEARREYLHDHPQADPSKHTVKKDHGEKPKEKHEEDHGEKHEEKHDEPKKSWRDRLKGLSEKASTFVKNAPKAVHKFIEDEGFRRKTLTEARKSLTEAPEKIAKNALKTVKHEVKEFKEAGEGISALMKGKKMNAHQKKALKAVSTHMAIGITAAALTASGPLAAVGLFGKGLVKHVALKAVNNIFGHAHVLEELGHIGHGVKHILEKLAAEKKEADPEDVLANLVMAAVAKELEGLSDEDIKKAIEEASGTEKEASLRVGFEDMTSTLKAGLKLHQELRQWANQFPGILRQAEQEAEGLPEGWVWQDRFIKFFQQYDGLEEHLQELNEDLGAGIQADPPPKARISYAINDFQFFTHPEMGRDSIAYDVDTLKEWAKAFDKWVTDSTRALQAEIRKGRRIQPNLA